MATAAPARALTAAAGASRYALALAGARDDAEIVRLLASTPFPGEVQVSLERAPSPTAAGAIDGDVPQLITARNRATRALVGVASRSERDLYVNGDRVRVGYLGQLRVDRSNAAWRQLLEEGFAFCRELHDRGGARFYLTAVFAQNDAARRLLERRLIRSAPDFVPVGQLRTFAIATRRTSPFLSDRPMMPALTDRPRFSIAEAGDDSFDGVIACLQRNLRRYQFAPHWTTEDFHSDRTLGLRPEHFVVALGDDRVIGCLARWDQTAFKQVVIRGYSRRLARSRPLLNALGPWCGVASLPPVGAPLRSAYLSHAAVDDDRADVFAALVAAQRELARAAGLEYVVAAFPPDHPFHTVLLRAVRTRTYDSVLYLGAWTGAHETASRLDSRPLQPEVAVL